MPSFKTICIADEEKSWKKIRKMGEKWVGKGATYLLDLEKKKKKKKIFFVLSLCVCIGDVLCDMLCGGCGLTWWPSFI